MNSFNFTRRNALYIGVVLLCVGFFAPWITVLGLIGAGPSTFTEVAVVILGSIGLLLLSAITRYHMRAASILVGVLILVEVANVWFRLSEQDTNQLVQPGWGLWFTTATCIYVILSTFIAKHPPMDEYRIRSISVADTDKPGSVPPPGH